MQSLVGSSEISGVVGWIIIKYGGIPRNVETDIVNIPITYEEDIIGWVALNTSQLPDKVCPFTIAISSDVRP